MRPPSPLRASVSAKASVFAKASVSAKAFVFAKASVFAKATPRQDAETRLRDRLCAEFRQAQRLPYLLG